MYIPALIRFCGSAARTWFGPLSAAYKVTLSITSRCNLRCSWCNIWKQESKDELTLKEYERFFRCNQRIAWLDLTGGEVTLRSDLVEIAESAARLLPRLFQFHFPCNGTLPERIEENTRTIASLGIPKVVVSISMDGPPDFHDTVRGRTGTWKQAVETYKRLSRIRGAEVYFGMTLTQENVALIPDTIHALEGEIPHISAQDIHVNLAHDTFYYGNPEVPAATPLDASFAMDAFRKMRGMPTNPILLLEWLYQRWIGAFLRTGLSPMPCQALSSSLFITPEGTVYPCTSWERKIGNLRNVDFDLGPIWNSREARSLAAAALTGRCPGCWTPCEAYQSIIARLPRPGLWLGPQRPSDTEQAVDTAEPP